MSIEYCEGCKRKLTEADFELGRALLLAQHPFCRSCAQAVAPKPQGAGPSRPVTSGPGLLPAISVGHRPPPAGAQGSSGLRRAVSPGAGNRRPGQNGSTPASRNGPVPANPRRTPAVPTPMTSRQVFWVCLVSVLLGLMVVVVLVLRR